MGKKNGRRICGEMRGRKSQRCRFAAGKKIGIALRMQLHIFFRVGYAGHRHNSKHIRTGKPQACHQREMPAG